MLSVADITVNQTDPSPSLMELTFCEATCPRSAWNVPEQRVQPQCGGPWPVLFPPHPRTHCPSGHCSLGDRDCLRFQEQGWLRDRSCPFGRAPPPRKAECPAPPVFSPGRGGGASLRGYQGRMGCSLCPSESDTRFLATVGNPFGFHWVNGRGLLFIHCASPPGKKTG